MCGESVRTNHRSAYGNTPFGMRAPQHKLGFMLSKKSVRRSVLKTPAELKKPFLALATLLGIASLVGCSTPRHYENDSASLSLQTAAQEVQAESRALELTMGALKDLMNQPEGDLKQPLKHYSAALNRLVSAADRTEATGLKMVQRSADYLQAWDKQLTTIDYQHIREVSQARKTEVRQRCETINHRYADSQAAVHPLINYLQDIRRALNTDLTVSGLESMKPVASNAEVNAAKVQTALTALANELNDSGAKMSSVTASARVSNQ